MSDTRITVCGAAGRMGREILAQIHQTEGVTLSGRVDQKADDGIVADLRPLLADTDVVIDFTVPEATARHAACAAEAGVAFVTGTTGLAGVTQKAVNAAAGDVAVVQAPNMSLGVNVLLSVVEQLAKTLPDYDLGILDVHHNKKIDAPSGTALRLAKATGRDPEIVSLRAGDIVGDHTVYLAGPGERIELTHRAHSRSTFAAGAVRAAKWVVGRPPGLYDMRDVLGL